MTTAEKILAVQTLFNEAHTKKYNGYAAFDCSMGVGSPVASCISGIGLTDSYSVEVEFIVDALVPDESGANRRALIGIMGERQYNPLAPSMGFDFTANQFYYRPAQYQQGAHNAPITQSGIISLGEVHKAVFRLQATPSGETSVLSISLDGAYALTPYSVDYNFISNGDEESPALTVILFLTQGVLIRVLSTKVYLLSGRLLSAQKGAGSFASPAWNTSSIEGTKYSTSDETVTITTTDPASETLIALYLDMAAQKMLTRLYPFDPTKTALDIPSIYDMTQVELATRLYARAGAEGEISHNENGVNRSYKTVDDEDILSRLVPYCKVL